MICFYTGDCLETGHRPDEARDEHVLARAHPRWPALRVTARVPPEGGDAYQAYKGTGSAIAAFIELAEEAGAEIVLPVAANAWPSGPVDDAAFEYIVGRICAAVADGCDAVLLDLHGAMVTRSHDDGEGELLRRLRAIAPKVPIGVALDMHTNLFPAMAENATVIAGYQTYPHVDMFETGLRAGRAVFALLAGRARPAMAWGNRPMLPHVMRQGSDDSPNRELQARCREMELQGALCGVGVRRLPECRRQPCRPVGRGRDRRRPRARAPLVRRTAGHGLGGARAVRLPDRAAGRSMARAQAAARRACRRRRPGGAAGPQRQLRLGRHHGHDDGAGGILDAGLEDVAAFAICDPGAVQLMMRAGIGADVRWRWAASSTCPSIGLKGQPRACAAACG
jgi:hypothetical protein